MDSLQVAEFFDLLSQDGSNTVTFEDLECLLAPSLKQTSGDRLSLSRALPKIPLSSQNLDIISLNFDQLIHVQSLEEFKLKFSRIVADNNILLRDINDWVITSIFKRVKKASFDKLKSVPSFIEGNFQVKEEGKGQLLKKGKLKKE